MAHRVQAGEGALFGGGTIIDDGSVVTAAGPPASAGLDLVHVVPNPFNPRTIIRFQLEEFAEGRVSIHDLPGGYAIFYFYGSRDITPLAHVAFCCLL